MPLHDPAHAFVPYPDAPVPHAGTGPLSGLRFGVKDLFDVAGWPTTAASRSLATAPPVLARAHATPMVMLLYAPGSRVKGPALCTNRRSCGA